MTHKGSIVISRQALLNMNDNLKHMWRGTMTDDLRSHLFGRMTMFDEVMLDRLEQYDYPKNKGKQYRRWGDGYNSPSVNDLFTFLHKVELYPREETIELYKLLAWHMEHKDEVQELVKELDNHEHP